MERVSFDSIFIKHPDGSLEPRQRIKVRGVEFGPGVRFIKGVTFAGIDFALFVDRYLQITREGDTVIIYGIYQ